ncbi:unnamed protein product, partial [Didymodactylos carnosus]
FWIMRHILLALLRPNLVSNLSRLPTWSVTTSLYQTSFILRSATTASASQTKVKESKSSEEESKLTTDKETRTVEATPLATHGTSTELLTNKAKCYFYKAGDVETIQETSQVQQPTQTVETREKLPTSRVTEEEKVYSSKIQYLVNEIGKLSLVDVMDLNELLKKTLKIQDVSIMSAGTTSATASPTAKKEEEEEDVRPSAQSVFKVRLIKYDDSKKVPVIKQVKDIVENINLVQAKKMVEAVPQVLRDNLSKADAETMKAKLEAVGGVCIIE